MKKITVLLIFFCLVLPCSLFSSCRQSAGGDPLSPIKKPSTFVFEGVIEGVECGGVVEILADGAGGKIVYDTPASLSSVSVSCEDGRWSAALDGITLEGASAEKLGAPLYVFLFHGEVFGVDVTEMDGERLTEVTVEGDGTVTKWYFSQKPEEVRGVRVCDGGDEVLWMRLVELDGKNFSTDENTNEIISPKTNQEKEKR